MEEIWKDIHGYEGLYQVSNLGNVKSLHYGQKICNHHWKETPSRLLKQKTSTSGYQRVELYKKDSRKCFYVHRLVADAFLDNPENKPQVNHKDGNKFNNNASNLEWATSSENLKHAARTGLRVNPMLGKKGIKNPLAKPIIQYDLEGNYVGFWYSIADAAREYGCSISSISACTNGRRKKTHGFMWKFLEDDVIPMKIDI